MIGQPWRSSRTRRLQASRRLRLPATLDVALPASCTHRPCSEGSRTVAVRLAPHCISHYIVMMRRLTNTTGRPADVARRSANALAGHGRVRDAFRRETFALPREAAREKAREMFRRFPKAAYMTEIESWRVLPGDRIEFTMRRLPSAD